MTYRGDVWHGEENVASNSESCELEFCLHHAQDPQSQSVNCSETHFLICKMEGSVIPRIAEKVQLIQIMHTMSST